MYKQKKVLIVTFLLMISFMLHGCNRSMNSNGSEDKLHSMLTKLKTYEADVSVQFLKDTEAHIIEMKQQVEIGGQYKITVESPPYLKGYTISFDGQNVTEYNPSIKTTVLSKASEARNQTLLSSFIHNYLNADEVKRENAKLDEKETVTIEVNIPGNFKYMAREKVWFDADKLKPLKMEIYDTENKVALQINFKNFKDNIQINFNT